jgi:hypothetical protein
MKQETLEKAADNWVRQPIIGTKRESFIAGYKLAQERMYSEEDLRKAFSGGRTVYNYKGEWEETYNDNMTSSKFENFDKWFEQFKKK